MALAQRVPRTVCMLLATVVLATATAHSASAQEEGSADEAVQRWSDFIHYVRIALPNRAAEHAERLLAIVGDDHQRLLNVVERGPYADYEKTLQRAMKIGDLTAVATRLADSIQKARIQFIREPDRIEGDIAKLGEGGRAQVLALERLKAAGQFAAPQLLKILQSEDPEQRRLHPHVLRAMVIIGRPLVYPLAVALGQLEPVQLGQVAQVLTDIGYPRAAPFVKDVLESATLDNDTRQKVELAYQRLARQAQIPRNVTAAELQLTLGENLYAVATNRQPQTIPGYDPKTEKGIVWIYDGQAGLLHTPVPPAIFGDVLAMRAAKRALTLAPDMSRALSLWLMANLRRENRLEQDQADPSYPSDMRPPQFYIEMAGPPRQHDVLHRALEDDDVDLALDAIAALDATAGTNALVNHDGVVQPLLRALSYPDRRVRFEAAFALTNARPAEAFAGSYLVVPILTEAVGQTGKRTALILATDEVSRNELVAQVLQLEGYRAIGGTSLEDPTLGQQIAAGAGVDVIITNKTALGSMNLVQRTAGDYRLAASPVLALVSEGTQFEMRQLTTQRSRLFWNDANPSPQALEAAIEKAIGQTRGEAISTEDADRFAARAISLLDEIALSHGRVYNVAEAEAALISALSDPREPIVTQVGQVLSRLDSNLAQQALAESALDETRPTLVRVSLLNSLAQSAKHFANRLTVNQSERLLELVRDSSEELAIASARAHGALALPSSHLKKMLVQ